MTIRNDEALVQASDAASSWLFESAMPLWLAHGVDWTGGGFYESLTLDDVRPAMAFKRLRVLARQIYVFSEGALQGVERAEEAVDAGVAFLFGSARHAEGGFASRQDMQGRITDPKRDLYDLAFVIFALAHAYRVSRDPQLRQEAVALVLFIQNEMRHPAGGYVESLPHASPRRQNPHMHLLEAALAGLEHLGDPIFAILVDELAGLCLDRFMNPERTLLFEYFSDDLSTPDRSRGRAIIEPGHHMEWAWLFCEVERVRGTSFKEAGNGLALFALQSGRNASTGLLVGELFEDGAVADESVRLWTHGEWLKAALRVEMGERSWEAAWSALSRFLKAERPGLWHEHWDPHAGGFQAGPVPASSLYHITTAILELRRSVA